MVILVQLLRKLDTLLSITKSSQKEIANGSSHLSLCFDFSLAEIVGEKESNVGIVDGFLVF